MVSSSSGVLRNPYGIIMPHVCAEQRKRYLHKGSYCAVKNESPLLPATLTIATKRLVT